MKLSAIIAAIMLLFASVAIYDDASAARMGGGKSFGSRPSMSQPAQRPMTRQQAPAAGAAAQANKGMLGGMGGIMGGLLAGTLLGSLLSGNGMGGGGGFMDLILLAILAFIGYKLFQRFRAAKQAQAQGGGGGMFNQSAQQNPFQQPMQRDDQGFQGTQPQGGSAWNTLSGAGAAMPSAAAPGVNIPAGFDVEEFLRGAKMAYNRLQQSWDKRDLNDIAQFVTPTVLRELQAQAQQDPSPSHTEIMMVNADLTGVEEEGANTRAQVYFDVLMRENASQPAPENVREIWHFLRIGADGNWKLDGIQQVD